METLFFKECVNVFFAHTMEVIGQEYWFYWFPIFPNMEGHRPDAKLK